MKKSFFPHVELIRDAIAHIDQYRAGGRDVFLSQPMVQDAIVMRIQVIGENLAAMRRIDEERFEQIADISWSRVIGLRNIISHGYHQINPERIWQVVEEELPRFSETLDVVDGGSGA